ncbi:hypothetical protein RCL1_009176 [Eukaryota sp. TZLM3-RCL]
MSQRIALSHSCLVRIFQQYSNYGFFEEHVASVLRLVSHVGNVSTFFRSVALDAVALILYHQRPSFQLPNYTSQLLFLRKLFPSSLYSISFQFKDFRSLPHLPLNLASISISGTSSMTEDYLAEFFSFHNVSTVDQFTITADCTESLCLLLSKNLPNLTSLSIRNTFLTSRLFVFPEYLDKLSFLEVSYNENSSRGKTFDISKLVHLKGVQFSGNIDTNIIGLSQLLLLESLELKSINSVDELNPSARLRFLSLNNVSNQTLIVLLGNRNPVKNAKLSLNCAEIPECAYWVFDSILSDFTPTCKILDTIFELNEDELYSTSMTPQLEQLFLEECSATIDCSSSPLLDTLYLRAWEWYTVEITFPLTCSNIVLTNSTRNLLYSVLKQAPYVKTLEISEIESKLTLRLPHLKFNYLSKLSISDTIAVYPRLTKLPRLKTLRVSQVDDFDFSILNTTFPRLVTLSITQCTLHGNLKKRNNSLVNIYISKCIRQSTEPNFLSFFYGLQHLSIDDSLVDSQDDALMLPPNLKSLNCNTKLSVIKDYLDSNTSLKAISGILLVPHTCTDSAREWFKEFKRSNLHCSALIKIF